MDIPAAIFKAECLKLMDEVARTREPIVITKHGRPVAQLVPVPTGVRTLFGYMKGTVQIKGDVVAPIAAEWSVHTGDEDGLYAAPQSRSRRRNAKRK
ncbi:MAG TPA: type II toxin-antitoxin system Phd/YefM family antitoxin [Steroidobacteraceae bacterium]|nr:type II toxin-antitoxin system Phd/YefM family antitoxin [Steroidobacteraceae bacterium]